MNVHRSIVACTLVASAVVLAACTTPPAATPADTHGRVVDQATAGSISGSAMFEGAPPAPELIKVASDMQCVQGAGPNPPSNAVLVGKNGGLENVFVYIKDGLDPSYTFDTPTTPVVLDQQGCFYSPRVLGVRVGQPLEVSNDDPTFHNVHALPKNNMEFNQGLNMRGSHMTHTFTVPEQMVRFKCDVHGWMAAWVGVMAHPYFAVTGPDGSFTLSGVPPGTYTIEAWHERFGTRTAKVVVGAHEAAKAAFAFTAAR
jgi:plastocyanin